MLVCLIASISEPSILVGAVCFWGVMLLHEFGHLYAGQMQGMQVNAIRLYPLLGHCEAVASDYEFENSIFAWGGFVAQVIVAIPAILILVLFGDFLPWYIYTTLFMFGYFSLLIALVSVMPGDGLDGDTCWKAIPIYFQLQKERRKRRR